MQVRNKAGRLALTVATGGFMLGMAFLNGGGAHAIGGLCNGEPATHTWLDASGQYGPAVIDGTKGDDTIIGSDGDDTIDGRGDTGDDDLSALDVHSVTLVGDGGNDTLEVGNTDNVSYVVGGSGDDVLIHDGGGHVKMDGGDDFDDCLARGGDELVNCEY